MVKKTDLYNTDPTYYRPSNLSVLSMSLERLIANQLLSHFITGKSAAAVSLIRLWSSPFDGGGCSESSVRYVGDGRQW
jgi:hypothetical protein